MSTSSTPVPITAPEHHVRDELVHALSSVHHRKPETAEAERRASADVNDCLHGGDFSGAGSWVRLDPRFKPNINQHESSPVDPGLRAGSPRAQPSAAQPCSRSLPAVADDRTDGNLGRSSTKASEHDACTPSMPNALVTPSMPNALVEHHEPPLSVADLCVESAGTCLTVLVTSCRRWLTRRRRQQGIVGSKWIGGDLLPVQNEKHEHCADGWVEMDVRRPWVSAELKWAAYLKDLGNAPAVAARSDTAGRNSDAERSRGITTQEILSSPAGLQKVISPALVPVEPEASLRWLISSMCMHLAPQAIARTRGRRELT
jgi:hypothetical protein